MTPATMSRDGNEDLVLFLHGLGCAKENFAGFWGTEALVAVRKSRIADAGHFILIDRPAALASAIAEVIAQAGAESF